MFRGKLVSIGSRKGELLDPNIQFLTWHQWKKSPNYTAGLRIGMLSDKEESLEIVREEEGFMQHVLVQLGVLKDAQTKTNKYFDKDDEDNRVSSTNAWGSRFFKPLLKDYHRAAKSR